MNSPSNPPSTRIRRTGRGATALLVLFVSLLAPGAAAQSFLPGDNVVHPSIGPQTELVVVEGGPGFLALWADERTVISGNTNAPEDPHAGNLVDVYGQILDTAGLPIGPPVVVANQGRDQREPSAAWNGENWLVAFESKRPDWYFDENIYAVRVSPSGQVLDPFPLLLFTEEDGQGIYDPDVASDGTNWVVIGDQWVNGQRTVRARRVAANGTILDPQPIAIQQSTSLQLPVIEYASGVYLLAANSYSTNKVYFRLFDTNLSPLNALTELGPSGSWEETSVATNGSRFMVVSGIGDAYRVEPNGTVLDPAGIELGGGAFVGELDVAWTGAHWAASMRTFGLSDYYHVHAQRISDSGNLIDPQPVLIEPAPQGLSNFEAPTGIAGAGNGDAVAVYVERGLPQHQADVRAARFQGNGSVAPPVDVSIGLSRQTHVRFSEADDHVLAVYLSKHSGSTRILSQRLTYDGVPLDGQPTVVHEVLQETTGVIPHVAWNGQSHLVAWQSTSGGPVAVRISPGNQPLDAAPFPLTPTPPSGEGYATGAVGAAGDVFVVGIFHTIAFHEPVRYVEYVRVAADGSVLDPAPVFVAGGYSREMTGDSIGDRGFLAWAQYSTHDSPSSYIEGILVQAGGQQSPRITIGSTGMNPDIADAGDRGLVVWHDDSVIHQDDVKGRLVSPDGTFLGNEFVISGAQNQQRVPATSFDGTNFTVAWVDFRNLAGQVPQLRGDIYSALVDPSGTVLDPGGVQVTQGPLPEDLPDVAAGGGSSIIAFSKLHGAATPEIQRIGYTLFGSSLGTSYCAGDGSGTSCPCGNTGATGAGCANSVGTGAVLTASGSTSVATDDLVLTATGLVPGVPALLFAAQNATGGGLGVPFGDGLRCAGGGVVRLGVDVPGPAGTGVWGPNLASQGGWQAGTIARLQAWYRDPAGPCGTSFNLSQGLELTFLP